ncbi:MAG: hypothetical protein LC799_05445, partial [Actinobacteria bacterium]|nr:hypothetical protein [Actinomycetota bacterium]
LSSGLDPRPCGREQSTGGYADHGDRGGTTSLLGLRWILRALSRVARPSPKRGYLVVAAAAL